MHSPHSFFPLQLQEENGMGNVDNIWPSLGGLGQTQIPQRGLGSCEERGAWGLKDEEDKDMQVA